MIENRNEKAQFSKTLQAIRLETKSCRISSLT